MRYYEIPTQETWYVHQFSEIKSYQRYDSL